MSNVFVDSDVKQWRPRLIELTSSDPRLSNSKVYLDPALIALVYESIAVWHDPGEDKNERTVNATQVMLSTGPSIPVKETPEQVNIKRDQAYGIVDNDGVPVLREAPLPPGCEKWPPPKGDPK